PGFAAARGGAVGRPVEARRTSASDVGVAHRTSASCAVRDPTAGGAGGGAGSRGPHWSSLPTAGSATARL
ncbi:hypothetical protein, partial [Streptomyces sp. 111WW2]|uniref:hypothetical protein n=1 Tax=Streptomyces sp. 111WW2 TaxID=1945515 RepID=UPI001A7E1B05